MKIEIVLRRAFASTRVGRHLVVAAGLLLALAVPAAAATGGVPANSFGPPAGSSQVDPAPASRLTLVSRSEGRAGRPSEAAQAGTISADGRFVAFRVDNPEGRGLRRLNLVDLHRHRTRYAGAVSAREGGPLSLSAGGQYLLFDTFVGSNVPKGSEPSIPASGDVYRDTNPLLP